MSLKRLSVTEVERALGLWCSRSPLLSGDLVSLHTSEIAEITGSSTFILFNCRKAEWVFCTMQKRKKKPRSWFCEQIMMKTEMSEQMLDRTERNHAKTFECSRHSDGHKCGAQLPYMLFIPVSCFRTVKPESFKLFTFITRKEIMHSPSNAHCRINIVLKRKSLLSMLYFTLTLRQKFMYRGTFY